MKNSNLIALLACLLFTFSCSPEGQEENEEELITTVTYTLTPVGGGTSVELSFKDLDGQGGNSPTIVGGVLKTNSEYNGVLSFKNESVNPAIDITKEIIAEATDHQVFFSVPQELLNSVKYLYKDKDSKGKPLGIETTFFTKAAGKGSLAIILRHKPNKSAFGVDTGNSQAAGGDTDIDVAIPLEIK